VDSITFLTVLGIAITLLVGAPALYLIIKHKYPGQITFLKESCIPLFDSIVKNMPELEVMYKNNPVSERLVLLKGILINSGKKDITEAMIEEKICLNLPEGFQWIAAKVVSTSPKVQATVCAKQKKLIFSTGLFRCKECIQFEALAEVNANNGNNLCDSVKLGVKLEKSMIITHRISDTQKIKKQDMPDISRTSKQMKRDLSPIILMFLMGLFIAGGLFFIGIPYQITYILDKNGSSIEVSIKPQGDGTVKISQVDGDFEDIMPVEVFFKNQNIKPTIVPEKSDIAFGIFIFFILLVFVIIGLLVTYINHRKAIKIRRMLSART